MYASTSARDPPMSVWGFVCVPCMCVWAHARKLVNDVRVNVSVCVCVNVCVCRVCVCVLVRARRASVRERTGDSMSAAGCLCFSMCQFHCFV